MEEEKCQVYWHLRPPAHAQCSDQMQKFKIIGKPLLGEKYMHGRRKIPSLMAPTSTNARTPLRPIYFILSGDQVPQGWPMPYRAECVNQI